MSGQMDFSTFTHAMFDLYRDKKYGPALAYVEKGMAAFPDESARITFWRVCLLSLCGRGEEALSVLTDGLEAGLWWHESQFRDADLDSIRDLPRFKELVSKSHQRWMEAGLKAEPDRTVLVPSRSGPYPLLIALHGYGGNKDADLKYWQIACDKGWMVLLPQSQQPLYP
jgi:A/B hydrolase-like, N-terminal domain